MYNTINTRVRKLCLILLAPMVLPMVLWSSLAHAQSTEAPQSFFSEYFESEPDSSWSIGFAANGLGGDNSLSFSYQKGHTQWVLGVIMNADFSEGDVEYTLGPSAVANLFTYDYFPNAQIGPQIGFEGYRTVLKVAGNPFSLGLGAVAYSVCDLAQHKTTGALHCVDREQQLDATLGARYIVSFDDKQVVVGWNSKRGMELGLSVKF